MEFFALLTMAMKKVCESKNTFQMDLGLMIELVQENV